MNKLKLNTYTILFSILGVVIAINLWLFLSANKMEKENFKPTKSKNMIRMSDPMLRMTVVRAEDGKIYPADETTGAPMMTDPRNGQAISLPQDVAEKMLQTQKAFRENKYGQEMFSAKNGPPNAQSPGSSNTQPGIQSNQAPQTNSAQTTQSPAAVINNTPGQPAPAQPNGVVTVTQPQPVAPSSPETAK